MAAETILDATTADKDRRRWIVLALVVVAQFMVVLDVAIVNVALPSIKNDLHFSQVSLQWVITAYAIVFGGVLLLGGRLADLFGRRRLFLIGLALFTAASLLDGLAWSEGSLIAFRMAQGLGAALVSPAALSILMTTFKEGRERNVALGVWGAVSGSGAAAGVLLGGVLTSALSWSWIFFVNVPVGIAVMGLGVSEDLKRNPCSGGGFEGDGVSESFELCDESSCCSFGVAAGEVVAAGVAVELAGAEDVPDRDEHRVGDGGGRSSVSASGAEALVLGWR